ncbi:ABC transporter substrate-binding protein [Marinobacter sp. M216]|uniref:ABC transporter substrate-binding protein n=1 Tax=Marinobacter albus TaxID=3030833 RepID=A0ABT7HA44_9GAMM|nr:MULTISPECIES: ABC transporter substrate-binding protein [unclassified Marinobacter]MBW7470851.1 ABC transporter substrate-binding protein [Marinobacter sp. F4218]MDK9556879.1 ABC transporter substrate-binding protein [Marinobacter sp. M216]
MRIAAKTLIWTLWAVAVSPAWPETQARGSLTVSVAAPAYWCPYACDVTGPRSGFTVDIARAALESEGYKVVYENLPYDRALFEAKRGRVDAIVPAFRAEAPSFIFPSYAVSLTEYCFYVPQNEPHRYHGLASLENMRFVATSGYSYGAEMDAYISDNQGKRVTLIGGGDVSNRLRELVRRERFDALLDDRLLFESSQNREGLLNAGCLDERHAGYLALSPEDPDRSSAIAQAFERGFKKLQENGQLCRILENYGLGSDAVPGLGGEYCPPTHRR